MGKASRKKQKVSIKELQKKEVEKKSLPLKKSTQKARVPLKFSFHFLKIFLVLLHKVKPVLIWMVKWISRLRWVFVGTLVFVIAAVVVLMNILVRPALLSFFPEDHISWFLGANPARLSDSDLELSMFDDVMRLGTWEVWDSMKNSTSFIGKLQLSHGSVVALYPKFQQNVERNLRSVFPALPETCEQDYVYEVSKDNVYISLLCVRGYYLLSDGQGVLANIQNDIGKTVQTNIFTSSDNDFNQSFEKLKNQLWKNLELVVNTGDVVQRFQALYPDDPLAQTISSFPFGQEPLHAFGRMKHGHFDFTFSGLSMKDQTGEYIVPPQSEAFLELSDSDLFQSMKSIVDSGNFSEVQSFYNFFEQATGMNIMKEMEKVLSDPYHLTVWRNYQEQRNDYVLAIFPKFQEEASMNTDYYHEVFQSFIPAQAPVKRSVTLQDGTKGEEWIIGGADEFELNDIVIHGYSCKESFYTKKNLSFITCIADNMTILATSKSRAEQFLSSLQKTSPREWASVTRGNTMYWKEFFKSYDTAASVVPWDFLKHIQDFELRSGVLSGNLESRIE